MAHPHALRPLPAAVCYDPPPFADRLERVDGCLVWTGALDADGYGVLNINGRRVRAHRYALEQATGPLPPELDACHSCDNPPCCDLDHLFAGTRADNLHDAIDKGRFSFPPPQRGEANAHAKITRDQATEIRAVYAAGGIRQVDLGRRYGLTQSVVSKVVRGAIWADA